MKITSERVLYGMVLLALAIQVALALVADGPVARGLAGVALLALALAAWSLRDKLVLSRPAMRTLHVQQEQLQTTIREKDAELVMANEQLKEEILEQRWSNQALDHQLHYADLILNSIADPVCVVSKAMRITRVNASLLQFTGFTLSEVIGQPLDRIVRAAFDRAESQADPLAAALQAEHELTERTAYLVGKSGKIATASLHLSLVRDSGKVVAGVVALHLPAKTATGAKPAGASSPTA
jgi:PAS domain S-box-containing protein